MTTSRATPPRTEAGRAATALDVDLLETALREGLGFRRGHATIYIFGHPFDSLSAAQRLHDTLVRLSASPAPKEGERPAAESVEPAEGDVQRRCWTIQGPDPISQCIFYNGHSGDHDFGTPTACGIPLGQGPATCMRRVGHDGYHEWTEAAPKEGERCAKCGVSFGMHPGIDHRFAAERPADPPESTR